MDDSEMMLGRFQDSNVNNLITEQKTNEQNNQSIKICFLKPALF